MNPVQHANISVKRRGGELEDYIDIHALIDSTKMLVPTTATVSCILFWGVQEVIIPSLDITSKNIKVSKSKTCAKKIIYWWIFTIVLFQPLGDFVAAMQDIPTDGLAKRLEKFHAEVIDDPKSQQHYFHLYQLQDN